MSSKNFTKSTKKIEEVKEVIQNKPDTDIVKVLEVFDNDVGKAINAFLTDGGKEALSKWSVSKKQERKQRNSDAMINSAQKEKTNETNEQSTTNTNQTKKSPNKKKAAKKEENSNNNNGRNNINDLVSSIINQSITTVPAAETPAAPAPPTQTDTSLSTQIKQQQTLLNKMNNLIISSQNPSSLPKSISDLKVTVLGIEERPVTTQSSLTSSPSSMSTTSMSPSLSLSNKPPVNTTEPAKIPLNNQFVNTNLNSNHPLTAHINKAYTNQNNVKNPLDKSQKDLQRQVTVLARIATQFQVELNKSQMNINQTFMQLRTMLDQRQNQLQAGLNNISQNGSQILMQRQQKAAQLKTLADNVAHLNDQDTLELKADIKHFVSERQLDEEFSKIKVFKEDNYNMILESINNFGKISQLNVRYAKQRPSVDEVLSNNFTASPKASPLPQRQHQQAVNKKAPNTAPVNTNGKLVNSNSSKAINANSVTNGNGTKKFTIPITDVNGLSDDLEDEGEFIESKSQKNKKKQQNLTEPHQNGSNGIHKETPHQNGWQTQTNGNGNSHATLTKKQKAKKNAAKNATNKDMPVSKANVNPYRLLAGFME